MVQVEGFEPSAASKRLRFYGPAQPQPYLPHLHMVAEKVGFQPTEPVKVRWFSGPEA